MKGEWLFPTGWLPLGNRASTAEARRIAERNDWVCAVIHYEPNGKEHVK